MREAIRMMRDAGVVNKTGGPFGAVIAKDGQVVAAAGNSVVRDLDPSAHAEVNAIRAACKKLGTWDLSGCVMYTSCECCPMCYATAYWAGIRTVFYAASWSDYSDLFSDEEINEITSFDPWFLARIRELARTGTIALSRGSKSILDGSKLRMRAV